VATFANVAKARSRSVMIDSRPHARNLQNTLQTHGSEVQPGVSGVIRPTEPQQRFDMHGEPARVDRRFLRLGFSLGGAS
jgi:hypothetical protein